MEKNKNGISFHIFLGFWGENLPNYEKRRRNVFVVATFVLGF